jgi:hypothetical protein
MDCGTVAEAGGDPSIVSCVGADSRCACAGALPIVNRVANSMMIVPLSVARIAVIRLASVGNAQLQLISLAQYANRSCGRSATVQTSCSLPGACSPRTSAIARSDRCSCRPAYRRGRSRDAHATRLLHPSTRHTAVFSNSGLPHLRPDPGADLAGVGIVKAKQVVPQLQIAPSLPARSSGGAEHLDRQATAEPRPARAWEMVG